MNAIVKILSIALIPAVLLAAGPAFGAIETRVAADWESDEGGNIVVAVHVHNEGEETAYALDVSMFLVEREFYRGALGDNPPGGGIRLDFLVETAGIKPGTYTGVIRVRFEEQNGRRHHVDHPLSLLYSRGHAWEAPFPLKAGAVDPVFNPKAFWLKQTKIPVTIANRGETPTEARLAAWTPEGFSIRPEVQTVSLDPGAEKTLPLSAALAGANRTTPYYVTVDAETEAHHHALLLRGSLNVRPEPLYFKIYLIFAAAGALLFFASAVSRR